MGLFGNLLAFATKLKQVPEEPKHAELYTESVQDRTIVGTATALTPENLLQFLRLAESGDLRMLLAFYREMRARDGHLDGELSKATRAITGAKIDILPYPTSLRTRAMMNTAEAKRAVEIAEYVKEQLLAPEIRLDKAISALCSGLWTGIAALEVEVLPGGALNGREKLMELCEIPAERFRYKQNTTELMFQPGPNQNELIPVEDLQNENRIVLLIDDEANPNPARRGILRRCIATWLVRNEGLRWWARYVELFGIPYRIGKHAANDRTTQQALVNAAKNAGAAGWAVIPDSASLEFLTVASSATGAETHANLIDWCGREMSKVINGGTQTSDIQQNSGSRASASVHADQMQALVESRAIEIAAVLREQLVKPLVIRNFGPDAEAYTPEIKIRVEDEEDLLTLSQSIKNLTDAGVSSLPVSWFHATSGIPMAEEDEPVIAKPTPTPAPFEPSVPATAQILPFRASASTPTVDPLLERASALAPGAADEIVAPYREVIDKAIEEGVDLTTVLVRVLHHARFEAVTAEKLQDLLASVMLDATMRGIADQRRERGQNA